MDQRSEQVEHTVREHSLLWKRNVPFLVVPERIVSQFKQEHIQFTFKEFHYSLIWTYPEHWNSALYFDGEMIAFIYGTYDPLEKDLFVKRLGADPSAQVGYKDWMVQKMLNEIDSIARERGAKVIWTMTSRRGFLKKCRGRGYVRKDKFIIQNDKF